MQSSILFHCEPQFLINCGWEKVVDIILIDPLPIIPQRMTMFVIQLVISSLNNIWLVFSYMSSEQSKLEFTCYRFSTSDATAKHQACLRIIVYVAILGI